MLNSKVRRVYLIGVLFWMICSLFFNGLNFYIWIKVLFSFNFIMLLIDAAVEYYKCYR